MSVEAGQPGIDGAEVGDPAIVFGDAPVFAEAVEAVLRASAPRLFAVLHEFGHREHARIAAWGLAFDDHVEVADVDGSCRMRLSSAERARAFLEYEQASAHLFWVDR
ncbi:hypothetical protein ACTG9Q_29345 [Actinokineospora sp. 24-640]